VTQSQAVGQVNYNAQSTAFAIAVNDSDSTAVQQSYQRNENLQEGTANATNVYIGDGEYADQTATASLAQEQDVEQANVNEQGAAIAIAVGENSTATAVQFTDQSNLNTQIGHAHATNLMASSPGMNIATAGDVNGDVLTTETELIEPDKKDKKDGVTDGSEQTATTGVNQEQGVEQQNVNLQNTALAIAFDGRKPALPS